MGVAGGRFVGLGADAEPPAPLSMAARSWSASLNGTLSVFTAKSVSALTSCNQHPQGVRRLVRRVGYGDGYGFARHEQEACQ